MPVQHYIGTMHTDDYFVFNYDDSADVINQWINCLYYTHYTLQLPTPSVDLHRATNCDCWTLS